ncbi:non-receptor serine/threonine protein kinase [Lithospermum erythrorhizon]|uniref:Non-receptor serine/threonine protein kinase n=1 Tax=Lithospermum erythrorhizon TaxID=34254 RepID=A0AAV3RZK7_LITER
MNMVRAMLSAKNMPKTLWPEAVNWTFYILNRCPTLAVKDMTPQEAWNGIKPSVIDLKIWGCLVHAHVPSVHRSKLDNRSSMCIFLGVSHETKGYRQELGLGKDYESQVSTTLVWEDVEIGTIVEQQQNNVDQEAAVDQPGEMDQETVDDENAEIEDNDIDAATPEQQPQSSQGRDNTTQRRIQRNPRWMQDYVSGEDISEDETYIVQDTEGEDPIFFDEARIGVKWIYKTKRDEKGDIVKDKARLMAKRYSQKEGIDYTEVYAPVARMDTLRMIISVAAQKGWKIMQLDVKSVFLHGELIEDVYVEQLRGYESKEREHMVYKLHKALYGLKQAPRAWFSRIERHFLDESFEENRNEHTLFTKRSKEGRIVISNYSRVKVDHDRDGKLVDDTLYKQMVGSLMAQVSTQYGIFYTKGKAEGELMVYTDSDYAGDLDDRKSTSGYVVLLNSGAVAWCSKKQPIVTLSTIEVEFVAATVCACQAIWMKRILNELVKQEDGCIVIRCDNSSSIKLSKNPVMHGRCKHIDVRFHFLRNLVKEGRILLTYCSSTNQIADVITKALKMEAFVKLRTELEMVLDWGEDGIATVTEISNLRASFRQEVAVWQKLDHPNVTKFVGASMGTSKLSIPSTSSSNDGRNAMPTRACCVVVEYLAGGTLKKFLIRHYRKKLPFKIVIQLALDLARGLSYLHSEKIVHRDVKSENMLLTVQRNLKIADFGVARVEAQNPRDMTGETGTLGYMAPEVLEGKPYNRKCDVYSFGICLWEIYCCDMPYADLSFAEVSSGVVQQNVRPAIPKCCPSAFANIMRKCWDASPDKRPEMEEVVSLLEAIDTSQGGGMIPDDQASGCFCFGKTRGP